MLNKRSKNTRFRGSRTHGGGHKKKRRGSGHRGGFGLAGSGKRGDSKHQKVMIQKGKKHYGKHGFKSINKVKLNSINLSYIDSSFEKLLSNNIIKKEKDGLVLDLGEMKIDKLLGSGNLKHKVIIKVKHASQSAIDKVKKLGGEVLVLDNKE